MTNTIKIVGLDPSMSNFGVARGTLDLDTLRFTVDELRLIKTEPESDKKARKIVRKNSEDLERARILHRGLLQACEGCIVAFAEVPVGSQSARAMASYGLCLGILAAAPVPLIQVTPSEVKVAATNCKTATKEEMIEWATAEYPNANWLTTKRGGRLMHINANEHLADAVATIKAGIATDQFRQAVSLMQGSLFTRSSLPV